MSKAAPWIIKGMDHDVRSAARDAARRSGVSLNEWLSNVVADQADELGVHPGDLDDDERHEAIINRLEQMERQATRHNRRTDRPAAPRGEYQSRPQEPTRHAPRARDIEVSYRDRDEGDYRRDNGAVDLIQRRLDGIEAAVGQRDDRGGDRQLQRTLSRLEARIETIASRDDRDEQDFDDDYSASPGPRGGRRSAQRYARHSHGEAADDLQERLAKIEASLQNRPDQGSDKDMRRMLSRLEARIETLGNGQEPEKAPDSIRDLDRKLTAIAEMLAAQKEEQRQNESSHGHSSNGHSRRNGRNSDTDGGEYGHDDDLFESAPPPVAQPAPLLAQNSVRPRELARIESKLNLLLSRDNVPAAAAEPAPSAPPVRPKAEGSRFLADAIADISERQQVLDGGSLPQKRPVRAAAAVPNSSDAVRNDLRSIAAKLDTLRQPAPTGLAAADTQSAVMQTAMSQATLSQATLPHVTLPQAANPAEAAPNRPVVPENNAAIEQLGRQIAEVNRTISGLAPRDSLAKIEAAIRDVSARVDRRNTEPQQGNPGIDELRQQVAEVTRAVTGLDPQKSVAKLEAAIGVLSARVDNSRQGGVKESILQPIEALIEDLKASFHKHRADPQLDTIEKELLAISRRMDQLGKTAPAPDDPRLAEIHQQTSSIKELLAAAVSRPMPVDKIERQLQALGKRIDLIASRGSSPVGAAAVSENVEEIRASLVQSYPALEFSAIQDRIEALSDKFDEVIAHKPSEQPIAALSARLEEVQKSIFQRLDRPTDESARTARKLEELMLEIRERMSAPAQPAAMQPLPDSLTALPAAFAALPQAFESQFQGLAAKIDSVGKYEPAANPVGLEHIAALEDNIRMLAEKIDRVTSSPDNSGLAELQAQVREIAERIDHPNVSLEVLTSMEQTMSGLLNQFEETRLSTADVAETAARNATREALDEIITRGALANVRGDDSREMITREITGLRTAQETKDQRTHATLSAVHETLEKVVDRLAMVEDNISRPAFAAVNGIAGAAPASGRAAMAPVTARAPVAAPDSKLVESPDSEMLASGPAPLFERRPLVTTPSEPDDTIEDDGETIARDAGSNLFEPPRVQAPAPQERHSNKDAQDTAGKQVGKDRQASKEQQGNTEQDTREQHRGDNAAKHKADQGPQAKGGVRPDGLNLSEGAAALWQDEDDDVLLEPGSGRPQARTAMAEQSSEAAAAKPAKSARLLPETNYGGDFDIDELEDDELARETMAGGKSSSSFIAAARRASIAAQARADEADAAAAGPARKKSRGGKESAFADARARAAAAAASLSGKLERKKGGSESEAAKPGNRRSALRNRKVLLSLGLAAAVLVLGTMQFLRTTGGSMPAASKLSASQPAAPITAMGKPATPGNAVSAAKDKASGSAGGAAPDNTRTPPTAPDAKPQHGAMISNSFSKSGGMPAYSNSFVKPANTAAILAGKLDSTPVASISGAQGVSSAQALAAPASNRLQAEARSGNASAQYDLAVRYIIGRTLPRDHVKAVSLLEKAAAAGLPMAQYRLASMYEKGIGVKKDPARALGFYEQAGNAGNIRAMHNYAVLAAEGVDGKPDYAKAALWFQKAAEHGIRDSQYNLAILYARGLGISRSMSQSYKWFAIAAGQGDKDAGTKRDQVAKRLSPAELARARKNVSDFRPRAKIAAANTVSEPAGGWKLETAKAGKSTAKAAR